MDDQDNLIDYSYNMCLDREEGVRGSSLLTHFLFVFCSMFCLIIFFIFEINSVKAKRLMAPLRRVLSE